MSRATVYLAGPIAGLDYDGATEWRRDFAQTMANCGIKALSPMRGFAHLRDVKSFCPKAEDHNLNMISGPRAVMTRDRFDATRCDVLLVNLLGATKVSIGSCMEIAWADLCRTPIVAVMEPGNPHEHAMINEAIGFRVETLEEASVVIRTILL